MLILIYVRPPRKVNQILGFAPSRLGATRPCG